MTADELIQALQKFTPAQRRRDVWMEADAGYAVVGGADLVEDGVVGKKVIALSPEGGPPQLRPCRMCGASLPPIRPIMCAQCGTTNR